MEEIRITSRNSLLGFPWNTANKIMGLWGKKHLPTGARLLPFTVVPCLAKLGNHWWGSNMFDQLGTCTQCGPPTIQWTRNLPMISGLVKHGNGKILIYRCLSHVHACTSSFTGDFSLPWLITKGYSTYIYTYTYRIQYNIVSSQWYLTISHAPRFWLPKQLLFRAAFQAFASWLRPAACAWASGRIDSW